MQIGFVGLGKMGLNMVTRLQRGGHPVVAYDRSAEAVARAEAAGAGRGVLARDARRGSSPPPRAVWVMVPAGEPTESTVSDARQTCCRPATRSSTAATRTSTTMCGGRRRWGPSGIEYVDAGTSGGIWGLQEGYCLMVGGDSRRLQAARADLSDARAARRLSARRRSRRRPLREDDPQRHRVRADAGVRRRLRADARERVSRSISARSPSLWNHGSVVRSWLLELTARALAEDRRPGSASRATSRIPAKDAGRCTKPSIAACRCPVTDRRAVHAVPLARRQPVLRAAARGAPASVRRPRREAAMEAHRTRDARHLRRRRRPRAPQAPARALQPSRRRPAPRTTSPSSASAARR